MHHFPDFPGFDHDPRPGAESFTDQVVMEPGRRQEGGDGSALPIHLPIAENDHRRPSPDQFLRPPEDSVEGVFQGAARLVAGREEHFDLGRRDPGMVGAPETGHIFRRKDRVGKLEPGAVQRGLFEEIMFPADPAHQGHHQFFPERIDSRIGHLGEELFEIGIKQLGLVGESRQGGIVAHRPDRFLTPGGHRADHQFKLLVGVAECVETALETFRGFDRNPGRAEQSPQLNPVIPDPAPVGLAAGDPAFNLVVGNDAAFIQIEQKHLPGLEPAPFQNIGGIDLEDPGLRGQNHQTASGYGIPGRPEAVAVQGRA